VLAGFLSYCLGFVVVCALLVSACSDNSDKCDLSDWQTCFLSPSKTVALLIAPF